MIGGAALLSSGRVALVVNIAAMLGGDHAAAASMPAADAGQRTARRRVLVVDDSITTRTLEQSVLEAAGYEVTTAVDGADGWRILQAQGADLVVSDVEMPRMDGLELCTTIRATPRWKELPVILVTALESAEHRARGLEIGASAYLPKSSFDQDELLNAIRDLLE